jgi:DNA mismatch endonuclease (patch repair protein)
MGRIGQRDTSGEVALRKALFAEGLRYRLQVRVPDRPRRTIDIAFPSVKFAVFVDGCYWHGCPVHGTQSKTNSDWWRAKIEANRLRDADTNVHLESIGWAVFRVWEHEDAVVAALRIGAAVNERR